MARINRTDVIQKAVNDLALSTATDKIPSETLDKVQLVYSLNTHFSNFIHNNASSSTGTITLATLPSDSRVGTYLTGATISLIKDATCDVATGRLALQITPENQGVSKEIIAISVLTLTAQEQSISVSFPYPIKLKQGTTISFLGTFTVGAMSRYASVTGFTTSSN